MNRTDFLGPMFALPLVFAMGSGCRGPVAQIAEEQIAEAVVNQAVSAYYTASVNVSGEYASLTLTCTKGGTLSWAEYVDGTGEICYESESTGCEIEGENYGDLTLSGTYDVCGFPTSYNDEEAKFEDLDGKTLYIAGSVTVAGANVQERTCNYDLQVTKINITGDGDTLTFASGVSGEICDRRNFSTSVEFTVTNDVEVDESME